MSIEKDYPFSNRQVWLDLVNNLWNLYTNGSIKQMYVSRGSHTVDLKDVGSYDNFVKLVLLDRYIDIGIKPTGKSRYTVLCGDDYASCYIRDESFIINRNGYSPIKIPILEWSNYCI